MKIKKEYKKLYDENGALAYEGETFKDRPYGEGRTYYPDGTLLQEGEFGIKGFLGGKEYFSNGQLRLEGEMVCHRGYGPNYPDKGTLYDEDGKMIFSGKFRVRPSGVGWPIIIEPEGCNENRIGSTSRVPWIMWDDLREGRTEDEEDV